MMTSDCTQTAPPVASTIGSSRSSSLDHQTNNSHDSSSQVVTSSVMSVPRNVILHKDEKGFGLKVSGSQPVFVAEVAENGAAWRAGVRYRDQIIKVNGTNVTRTKHEQVVNMILGASGKLVALTLLADPSTGDVVPQPPSIPLNLTSSSTSPAKSVQSVNSSNVGLASADSKVNLLKPETGTGSGRRSFFSDPSKKFFKSMQSKSNSALDAAKAVSQEDVVNPMSSSLSSLAFSSSSSSNSEESNDDEEDYVSASSDPSTPILPSSEFKRKKRKKNKRSKSLQEGVVTTTVVTESNESKAKEFEQALEEEEKERKLEREKRRRKLKQRKLKFSELISTERSFGAKLRLLHYRFYEQMVNTKLVPKEEISTLFGNHHELYILHNLVYFNLKKSIKPLLKMKRGNIDWKMVGFHVQKIFGELGPRLEEQVAIYCSNSTAAHELLKSKMKTQKFALFLAAAENTPELERLKFTDLLAAPVQRITRYPLLVNEVLNTFSTNLSTDPIESGKAESKKDKFIQREQEGRQAFETALLTIKSLVSGVNRKKTEFEFLSWFKQKVQPFYPRANQLTAGSIKVLYENEVQWMINKRHFKGVLLLLQDLILILIESTPTITDGKTTASSSTLSGSMSSPALVSTASTASTSPSTSNIPSSSSSFSYSFMSETVRRLELQNNTTFVLKIPPAAEGEKHLQTFNPVVEVSVSLETRNSAVNRRAFYLLDKGNSEAAGSTASLSGKSSKESTANLAAPAMYEFDAFFENAKDEFRNTIQNLVEAKKLEKERNGMSPIKSKLSGCTNPFMWSDAEEAFHRLNHQHQSMIPRIRNRPLPPLPSSVSFSSALDRESKASRMKRSKSQEGRSRRHLTDGAIIAGGDTTGIEDLLTSTPPSSQSLQTRKQGFHPRNPSDSDILVPVAGRIERMPEREPLNNFADSVTVTHPPHQRFAQRITVNSSGSHHYANDMRSSFGRSSFEGEAYEEVREEGYNSLDESRLNKQIMKLLMQRKNLLKAKYAIPSNQSSDFTDWISFAVDAFTLELLTLDEKEWSASGQLNQSDSQSDRLHENEINELRLKMINVLTK